MKVSSVFLLIIILLTVSFVRCANIPRIVQTKSNTTRLAIVGVNGTKIQTNQPTKNTSRLSSTSMTKRPVLKRPSNSSKIITTRFGADGVTPEHQCQCVQFYLCDRENVFQMTTNSTNTNERCDDLNVCCTVPVNYDNSPPLELDSTDPITTMSTLAGSSPAVSTNNLGTCVCVPIGQCTNINPNMPDSTISGSGNIDLRQPSCTDQEVCCLDSVERFPSPPISPNVPLPSSGGDTSLTPTNVPCGLRRSSVLNRIIAFDHEKNTSFGEFPWMSLILTQENSLNNEQRGNMFVCGASLLSTNVVLTAAHCVNNRNPAELKIRVGDHDTHLSSQYELLPHQERSITRIIVHPEFNNKVLYNDLALLVADRPFDLAENVAPICFPSTNNVYATEDVYDGSNCVATGWGKDAFAPDATYQTVLKKVNLALVPREQCQQQFRQTRLGPFYNLHSSFICAGGQSGTDTCEGDGGGPLVCPLRNDRDRYVQVGLVSWGIGCGENIPAAYASLYSGMNWITGQLNSLSSSSTSFIQNDPSSDSALSLDMFRSKIKS